MLDNSQLKKLLPHASPFLLLDCVQQYIPGQSLVAVKNISADEWPFSEFPQPLKHYPETLLIEAAAQAALVLYGVSKKHIKGKNFRFILGRVTADFQNFIRVGQRLTIDTYASKMFDQRGYMDMDLYADLSQEIGKVQIFYSVVLIK